MCCSAYRTRRKAMHNVITLKCSAAMTSLGLNCDVTRVRLIMGNLIFSLLLLHFYLWDTHKLTLSHGLKADNCDFT
ncbi:Hypothetical predicted protein [Podarcis lilfordi]|uniref:Uncharacterized protein n=1 Tax=Podarcis lilfordi TaxID=74358 RepID=A0AA35KJJ6_9SAUR|nr:Hypothetical predicted protein [Podarcis lilfordi]